MTPALRKPTPLRVAFSATPEEESRLAAIREAIAQVKAESNAQHRVQVAPVVDPVPARPARDTYEEIATRARERTAARLQTDHAPFDDVTRRRAAELRAQAEVTALAAQRTRLAAEQSLLNETQARLRAEQARTAALEQLEAAERAARAVCEAEAVAARHTAQQEEARTALRRAAARAGIEQVRAQMGQLRNERLQLGLVGA